MSKQVSAFELEKLQRKIEVLYDEIDKLSKKKPDDAINTFKLKFVNEFLEEANNLLDNNQRPFTDFEQFDDDDLPSNSDVIVVLSQYRYAIGKA